MSTREFCQQCGRVWRPRKSVCERPGCPMFSDGQPVEAETIEAPREPGTAGNASSEPGQDGGGVES